MPAHAETDAPPRWTEYLPLDDLAPHPDNPKGHADADLAASLERFGYVEQIALDERTGLMIAGHGRRERLLARRAGGEEPPEGVTVGEDGAWMVPVQRGWASANDVEARAYLVASNKIGPKGGWLDRPLAAILAEVEAADAGFAGTGFDKQEYDDLLKGLAEPEPPEQFPQFDENLPTEHRCPKCGYEWSGQPA